jgi:putative ABC transport system permease protein
MLIQYNKKLRILTAHILGVITPTVILQTRMQFQSGTSFALAFIALLVGAVGIITTLYTSVNDRVSEIGTMKTIGASWVQHLAY